MIPVILTLHTGQNPTTGFCPFFLSQERRAWMGRILLALINVAAVVLEEVFEDD